MRVLDCPIPDLKVVQLDVLGDARGFFVERYQQQRFAEAGLPAQFFQDNHSRSAPGVLRGLHYQHQPPQGKLVGVTRGRIWDVAVDVRPHSASFGQHYALELSDMNGLLLWVPAGFAHGFCVLGDEPADVVYKVDAPYHAAGEGGISYDDPQLAIRWPVAAPVLSARDKHQQSWQAYCNQTPAWSAL